jgi:dihydroorotate dehydrogenase electron transfer subunit
LRVLEILEINRESPTVKTLSFRDKSCGKAEPGQFVMVWIPGVGEIPISLSSINPNGFSSITVAEVGKATKALHRMKRGDLFGIRGPYGNCFELKTGSMLIVGGGIGASPLLPLTEKLVELHTEITFLLGARTQNELLFHRRIQGILSKKTSKLIVTTEDGSHGIKGLVTAPAEKKMEEERFDVVYACGAEQMLYKLYVLAERHKTPLQVSLERLMRCAIGLCGSCAIGEFMVCKDGPVFSDRQLRKVKGEFGSRKLSFDGRTLEI